MEMPTHGPLTKHTSVTPRSPLFTPADTKVTETSRLTPLTRRRQVAPLERDRCGKVRTGVYSNAVVVTFRHAPFHLHQSMSNRSLQTTSLTISPLRTRMGTFGP